MKNLCVRESFVSKDGTEKSAWNKIGVLIEKNGKQFVKLFFMPGQLISVFEDDKKSETIRPEE